MKFTWFNLMPWPYLPDDFREKHRSVWVDIPNTLYDPRKGHYVYHQYMDQLEYAESLGFDGIGCNEHHQNGYGLMPSPNLIAAGLARRTSRAAICVIGNSIAGYNPPIRVAEEFAMLDVISGGRLVAGFPVGTPMDTNFCYGQIPALTRDKYQEAHDMIMKAWAEDEWELSRRKELKALGKEIPVGRLEMELPASDLALTAQPIEPDCVADAIFCNRRAATLAADAMAEYARHFDTFPDNTLTYAHHVDELRAIAGGGHGRPLRQGRGRAPGAFPRRVGRARADRAGREDRASRLQCEGRGDAPALHRPCARSHTRAPARTLRAGDTRRREGA
jgi:alkanesulfonate monooxygenase SsuD/methylene tetrahydromethanopterin reductase-like flavin-dependent oxidoreductase (luciferase family)